MIETASGAHVWADKIDCPKVEIFDIMDEVVDGLVATLCANLGFAEGKRAARQRPEDLHAWALCVQAETIFFPQFSAESHLAAEKLVRRASEIEPGYGVSWALLAFMIGVRDYFNLSANPAEDIDEALSLANKALSLAPQDPVVLGFCGVAYIWTGQTAQALDCLERSLEINANSSMFRMYYGSALWCDGKPEAGIAQLDIFMHLSPKDPVAGIAYFHYCFCYLILGDFALAEQFARKAVKERPAFAWTYIHLAMSLTGLGRADEARHQIRKVHQIAPAWTRQELEGIYRLFCRKPEDAEKLIALTRQAWPD